MTKKIISLLVLTIFMILPINTLATDVSVVARYDAGVMVNLSGEAEGDAVATVFYAEGEESPVPVFIRQFEAEGSYSINIQLPKTAESGRYIVYVTTAFGKASDTFNFLNAEKAEDALDVLKDAKDAAEAAEIAELYAVDLGIDLSDPDYMSNRTEIFTLLFDCGLEFESATDFNSAYYKMFALAVICGGDDETVKNMLTKYQTQLGIDFTKDITEDERLTEESVLRLYSVLSGVDFAKEFKDRESEDFLPIFNESKITAAIDAATDWQGIKKAFEDFDKLSSLLSDKNWKKINDKDDVYSKMMSYTYNNMDDVREGFEKAVAYVKKKESSSNNVSGSSSGGGGSIGGGSTSVVTPGNISETFPKPVELRFTDFDDKHWSFDAVAELFEMGIIKGYEDNSFRPDNTISRAEFTKLIVSLCQNMSISQDTEDTKDKSFDDVSGEHWFYDYIINASKMELINGDGNLFRPYDNITRQDAAVIIYRLISSRKSIGGNKVFSDRTEISDYAREGVAALGNFDIISGVGDNKFAPLSFLTRAQSAQLLKNTYEFLK